MKTVGLIVAAMVLAALYVFDVAGAREPMSTAATAAQDWFADVLRDVREALPAAPRAG